VGTFAGTWMAFVSGLKPTYPVEIAGWTLPGYSALYTVILNLVVVIVLTAVINALGARRPAADATVAADYQA
jgi:SSS family solute:Na+ symporter